MTDELDKIRAEKLAALSKKINKVEGDVADIRAEQQEFTWADFGLEEPEWGFRESQEMEGAFDICQNEEMVAMTADARWAMLVTDLLNRARLEELIMSQGEVEEGEEG